MENNKNKSEDTLIIVDASITEASLSGEDLISQSNSLDETTQPSPDDDTWEPVIGTTFDSKYKIEKKLGEGGMGIVYRATHIFIDRPVAIKFLRKEYLTDSEAIERFKLEARAAARIHHPNVTAILDFGIVDSIFYLVMEYLEGYSLRQQLKANGALSTKEIVKIMSQVCEALDAAHKSNIIHKDLKPDNIFLHSKEGIEQVKVLDFGIAEILGKASDIKEGSGSPVGTPHYMSPEQCQNDPVSPASDIYSLGIILFEMLTGQLPFDDNSAVKIVLKHLSSPPPKPTDILSTIPEEFNNIVIKALAKNPEKRHQTATMLLEDLHNAEKAIDRALPSLQEVPSNEPSVMCSNPKCGQLSKVGNKRCPRCQALSIGTILRHRYLIEKMVGKGGFGTTYLVKDLDCFDEYRILKELTLNVKDEDPGELKEMAERLFKREAQVLLNLYHSGIPRLYAYFADDNFSYLVQDFIPGQTLSEELKKRKVTVSEQEALSILSSLTDILDYLHSHNPPVIHRDIKPHNLMRHEDGRIMLIDFGAVCQSVANPQASHTVIGSLGYAPPEQFLGQTTPQSDLYALGASVIYLLTGIPPRLLLSNNSLNKLDLELEGKIKSELLLLLKDLVNSEAKKRVLNTKELKNRLQSLINPVPQIVVDLVNDDSFNLTNTPSIAISSNQPTAEAIIKPASPSNIGASTPTGSTRPSLSEAFAKMTGSLPALNPQSASTSSNAPSRTTPSSTVAPTNKEYTTFSNDFLPKSGQHLPTNTPLPTQTQSKNFSPTTSNPITGQQPSTSADLSSSLRNPLGQTPISKPTGQQQVIQPLTTKPESPINTPKQATPSLSQVLTNKTSFPQNQANPLNQPGQSQSSQSNQSNYSNQPNYPSKTSQSNHSNYSNQPNRSGQAGQSSTFNQPSQNYSNQSNYSEQSNRFNQSSYPNQSNRSNPSNYSNQSNYPSQPSYPNQSNYPSRSTPITKEHPKQPSPPAKEAPKQPGIDFQAVAHFSYEVESMLRLIDFGNYFAILGINADASTQDILDAYRGLSDKFHPNKYTHLSSFYPNLQNDLTKISARLYEAFETLLDQNKRTLYKRSFRTGTFEQIKPPDKR